MAAAALAGLASAVLTRLLMRVVEVLTNGTPHFSLGGLVAISSFYVLCLLPGCIALAAFRGRPARRWSWALFVAGSALLGFMAVNIGVQETNDTNGMTPTRWLALAITLVAMVLIYAAQVAAAARWARGLPLGPRSTHRRGVTDSV